MDTYLSSRSDHSRRIPATPRSLAPVACRPSKLTCDSGARALSLTFARRTSARLGHLSSSEVFPDSQVELTFPSPGPHSATIGLRASPGAGAVDPTSRLLSVPHPRSSGLPRSLPVAVVDSLPSGQCLPAPSAPSPEVPRPRAPRPTQAPAHPGPARTFRADRRHPGLCDGAGEKPAWTPQLLSSLSGLPGIPHSWH